MMKWLLNEAIGAWYKSYVLGDDWSRKYFGALENLIFTMTAGAEIMALQQFFNEYRRPKH